MRTGVWVTWLGSTYPEVGTARVEVEHQRLGRCADLDGADVFEVVLLPLV